MYCSVITRHYHGPVFTTLMLQGWVPCRCLPTFPTRCRLHFCVVSADRLRIGVSESVLAPMDGAVEGAGSCDKPAPKATRSSMFRRYQAEVMAARANTQVRRSSELVKKHRIAEAVQLAAEAAEEAAAEAAQHADRAAEHAADQAAGLAADQLVANQAAGQTADQVADQEDVREGPSGVTQRLLERARTEAPIAAEEMTLGAAPSVRVAAVEMWTVAAPSVRAAAPSVRVAAPSVWVAAEEMTLEAAPSVRVAAVEGSISTRTALAEQPSPQPGAAPPAPPPTPPPAAAASKHEAAPHPPEPLAQGDDLHQRDNHRDELAVTQLSSSGSVHVLARGNANGGED